MLGPRDCIGSRCDDEQVVFNGLLVSVAWCTADIENAILSDLVLH